MIIGTCRTRNDRARKWDRARGCASERRAEMTESDLIHPISLVIEGSVLLDGVAYDRVRKSVEERVLC